MATAPDAVAIAHQVRDPPGAGGRRDLVLHRPDLRLVMRFLPVNLDALLVELDDLDQTLALLASLENDIAGVTELVPAARTRAGQLPAGPAVVRRAGARDLAPRRERAGRARRHAGRDSGALRRR